MRLLAKLPLVVLIVILATPAGAADRLPKSMLGMWAMEIAACSEQASELAMTVEPRFVLFYEHGYEIKSVSKLKDGSLKASGYSVADGERSRGSITLKLVSADQMQVRGETYHRCKR